MRDHSKHILLTREKAIAKLIEVSDFHPQTETVNLHDALGRVTAGDCASRCDVPNALCAQMDGIAVRFDDFASGMPDFSGWQLGRDFDWANTGTVMPQGFDTAIAIERVELTDDNRLTAINQAPESRGESCRQPGSTFREGDPLFGARTRLTPAKISALAMCGYTEVEVVKKPRVVFIPTGDELVEPGRELPYGKAYESNGILLEMKMRLWGAEPVIYPCLPDDWDQIERAVQKAVKEADIVAINAGSSKGSKDFTMEILQEIGIVFCHETNHGPGHHTSASAVGGMPVLGISGPPGGCEITADWYLKPLVDEFLYGHPVDFAKVKATLAEPLEAGHAGPGGKKPRGGKPKGPVGEDFFAIKPMRVESTPEGVVTRPVKSKGHANLLELDTADGYLEENPGKLAGLEVGSEVELELRYPYTTL